MFVTRISLNFDANVDNLWMLTTYDGIIAFISFILEFFLKVQRDNGLRFDSISSKQRDFWSVLLQTYKSDNINAANIIEYSHVH